MLAPAWCHGTPPLSTIVPPCLCPAVLQHIGAFRFLDLLNPSTSGPLQDCFFLCLDSNSFLSSYDLCHSGLNLNITTLVTQSEEITWPMENRHGTLDLTCEATSYFICKIIILRENAYMWF